MPAYGFSVKAVGSLICCSHSMQRIMLQPVQPANLMRDAFIHLLAW